MRDAEGTLAVELNKVGGQKTELGLEPGQYSVVLDTKTARLQGDVRVASRQPAQITLASLRSVPLDKATPRGVENDMAGRPPRRARADNPDSATAIGAAVGEIVGSAIGKAMGTAVNAAISAAAGPARSAPPSDSAVNDADPAPAVVHLWDPTWDSNRAHGEARPAAPSRPARRDGGITQN